MRILTFNHHESYLCSLAGLGHQWDVVTSYGDLDLSWNIAARPLPPNFRTVPFDQKTRELLRSGGYDVVVCHTLKNLLWLWRYGRSRSGQAIRFVFVAHIPLFKQTFGARLKSFVKKQILRLFCKTHRTTFLAVSDFKYKTWEFPGEVVVLTPLNIADRHQPPRAKQAPKIVIVCNQMKARGEELGIGLVEALQKRFDIEVIGNNPGIEGAYHPRDFEDFKQRFASGSIYLYTIGPSYGDGYNTAMLEAMAMGMAMVTVPNPSSPLVHEESGLVGHDEQTIAQHLTRLIEDQDLRARLGAKAQDVVGASFSQESFLDGWQRALLAAPTSSKQ